MKVVLIWLAHRTVQNISVSETPRTDAAMSCKPDEIEGAICDRCGNGIGPFGCCATIDWAISLISKLYTCSQEIEVKLRAAQAKLAALTAPGEYGDLVDWLRSKSVYHDDGKPDLSDDGRRFAAAATAIEQLQERNKEFLLLLVQQGQDNVSLRERIAQLTAPKPCNGC